MRPRLPCANAASYNAEAAPQGWQRSQGGAEFPTGGICAPSQEPASARHPAQGRRGQQTWCDARADGHSPDERDRESGDLRPWVQARAFAHALVLANHFHRE